MSGCGQANDAVIVSARTARAIFRQPFADQAIKVGTFAFAYLSSFYEDSDFEVLLNFRPLSDTDVMLEGALKAADVRSEEHTSELQSLMRISYAVFCLKKKTK